MFVLKLSGIQKIFVVTTNFLFALKTYTEIFFQ